MAASRSEIRAPFPSRKDLPAADLETRLTVSVGAGIGVPGWYIGFDTGAAFSLEDFSAAALFAQAEADVSVSIDLSPNAKWFQRLTPSWILGGMVGLQRQRPQLTILKVSDVEKVMLPYFSWSPTNENGEWNLSVGNQYGLGVRSLKQLNAEISGRIVSGALEKVSGYLSKELYREYLDIMIFLQVPSFDLPFPAAPSSPTNTGDDD